MLSRLFSAFNSSVKTYADTFCFNRNCLNEILCDFAKQHIATEQPLLLLAHFPETMETLQKKLESQEIPFDIQSHPFQAQDLNTWVADQKPLVILTLREMLDQIPLFSNENAKKRVKKTQRFSILIAERHPHREFDDVVLNAAKRLESRVKVGFFVSLDDPILTPLDNEWTRTIFEYAGVTEENSVGNHMLSGRVKRLQKRYLATHPTQHPAFSSAEYLKINGKNQS